MIYSVLYSIERVLAERTLPISNLKPLNELTNIRLKEPLSPHKILSETNVTISDSLTRDMIAINEFLNYVKAEPYITPEKAENFKRVAFKVAVGTCINISH